jgi:hypothetical protein
MQIDAYRFDADPDFYLMQMRMGIRIHNTVYQG